MEKKEFLEKLSLALVGQVPQSVIAENIRYYDNYITEEVRKGRSVSEVLEELGDARLIAKSVIDANGGGNDMAGVYEDTSETIDGVYEEAGSQVHQTGTGSQGSQSSQSGYQGGQSSQSQGSYQEDPTRTSGNFHSFHFNGFWFALILIAIFMVIFMVVGTILGGIFILLRPVLVPLLLVFLIYSVIRGPRGRF